MQKWRNRALICLSLFIPLFLISLYLTSYKPQFVSFFPHLNYGKPCRTRSLPLRVYMYDFPTRFNVRLMSPNFPENATVTAENIPKLSSSYRIQNENSVAYWMMASLLNQGGNGSGSGREAVRVSDPDSADVFFVPFFSSLSFTLHGRNMAKNNTVDHKLQNEVVNILKASDYWKRSGGRDHVIPLHHPNAFRHYRDKINAAIFVVADFGRIMKITRLSKDVVAPYQHVLETYNKEDRQDPYESRKILLFFRGGTKRKDEGKIRVKLQKFLNQTKDVIYEEATTSEAGFKASTEQMRSSKFCLNPAGDTPSSCRLFDAIASHCIPVIVSNRIELPFESEIDYKEFSIFFSVEEALKPGYMVSELQGIPKEKWIKMWSQLKTVAHHFEYQYPPMKDDAVNMIWRQVRQMVPKVNLAVHRSRRLKIPDWWA